MIIFQNKMIHNPKNFSYAMMKIFLMGLHKKFIKKSVYKIFKLNMIFMMK